MGASRNKPKRCETCAFYKPGDLKGQGWCTHPKRQQTGGILLLVRGRALDCRNSWGEDFWTLAEAAEPAETSSPAKDAAPVHTTTADDLVIQQTSSTRNEGAAMTTAGKNERDDDESINHAALSDQEDRAHVMARGARAAILRARERKKERLSSTRQARMTAMPAADMDAGDWADFDDDTAESVTDDTVLKVRHQPVTDPFRRSYNDPAPPVPSRELPAEARHIISRSRDERFDSVPEVREGIELPRPAHAGNASLRATADEAADESAAALPDDPERSSYDRVLQQARRIQRLSTTRRPQRVIRQFPEGASASTVTESRARLAHETHSEADTTPTRESAAGHVTGETHQPEDWHDESLTNDEPAEEAFDEYDAGLDNDATGHVAVPENDWNESDNPFPEDENAPWLAAESMTLRPRSQQPRPRFRMPQLSFWRHGQLVNNQRPSEPLPDAAYHEDEVVAHSVWPQNDLEAVEAHVEDDPDWADDAVPVETYAAERSSSIPADVAAVDHGTVAWDESWAGDDWADEDVEQPAETAPEEDFVTAEATVPHRPQPAPASVDMAYIRARLFAQQREASPPPTRDNMTQRSTQAHAARISSHSPDDDPDPDPEPGARFEEPARFADEEWLEPANESDFDVREVVRRQGELLDMRIQIAPDVPRECRTCRNFRPAEGGERGWCTNEWAFSHRRMVNADDLPCESSIGCWWLPNDATWLPEDDLAALTQPTPLVDRLLGRLRRPQEEDEEEPLRARAR